MKWIITLSKKGYTGVTALFVTLNSIKICSIIILCTTHTKHPEILHNKHMAHIHSYSPRGLDRNLNKN